MWGRIRLVLASSALYYFPKSCVYPGSFVNRFELDFVNCNYRVQNVLVRQESIRSGSSAQSGERMRANPH
jgi:hypothetical protein